MRRGVAVGAALVVGATGLGAIVASFVGVSEGAPAQPTVLGAGESTVAPIPFAEPRAPEQIGGERTREAAARAASRLLVALGDTRNVVNPDRVAQTLARHGTPALAAAESARYREGFRALAAELAGGGGTPLLRSAALGYRVEAFDGRSASVAVWKVSVTGTSGSKVLAVFDTTRVRVVWTPGGWRVSEFGAEVRGPTPKTVEPDGGTVLSADVLVPVITGFEEFTP